MPPSDAYMLYGCPPSGVMDGVGAFINSLEHMSMSNVKGKHL